MMHVKRIHSDWSKYHYRIASKNALNAVNSVTVWVSIAMLCCKMQHKLPFIQCLWRTHMSPTGLPGPRGDLTLHENGEPSSGPGSREGFGLGEISVCKITRRDAIQTNYLYLSSSLNHTLIILERQCGTQPKRSKDRTLRGRKLSRW